jgi:hypothetical protein
MVKRHVDPTTGLPVKPNVFGTSGGVINRNAAAPAAPAGPVAPKSMKPNVFGTSGQSVGRNKATAAPTGPTLEK